MTIETIIIGACGVLLLFASYLIDYWMRKAKRANGRLEHVEKECFRLAMQNHKLRSALSKEQRKKLEKQTHLERRRN